MQSSYIPAPVAVSVDAAVWSAELPHPVTIPATMDTASKVLNAFFFILMFLPDILISCLLYNCYYSNYGVFIILN